MATSFYETMQYTVVHFLKFRLDKQATKKKTEPILGTISVSEFSYAKEKSQNQIHDEYGRIKYWSYKC